MLQFLTSNLFLIVICAIMLFIAIYNLKQQKRMSICLIVITGLAFLLAVSKALELYLKAQNNIIGTTIFSFIGYVVRPVCIIAFIVLSKGEPKGKWMIPFLIPAIINLIIFTLAFIPSAQDLVFSFTPNERGGISFHGGPLRFSSHIVAGLYLIYFVNVSILRLKLKHISNAVIILICVFMIVTCVILETFDDNGELNLLNTGIVISVMFYYLFLYIENGRRDPLTGLFNRATYYSDVAKMEKSATGVIQFDMNGLKYLNDNFGHQEGDKAIQTVANAIVAHCNRRMYAYRLGGDEFIVIVNATHEEEIKKAIEAMEVDFKDAGCSCAIGFAYREDKSASLDSLIKEAEKRMYQAKDEHYKNTHIERRKALQ